MDSHIDNLNEDKKLTEDSEKMIQVYKVAQLFKQREELKNLYK